MANRLRQRSKREKAEKRKMILGTTNTSPRYLQAHCQSRTSPSTDQSFVKELAKPTQDKIVFKKFPTLLKKIKNATHSRHSMTLKLNTENGLQGRTTRTTGYNTRLAQWGLTSVIGSLCFYCKFALADSLVFQNSPLRQARERYQ